MSMCPSHTEPHLIQMQCLLHVHRCAGWVGLRVGRIILRGHPVDNLRATVNGATSILDVQREPEACR